MPVRRRPLAAVAVLWAATSACCPPAADAADAKHAPCATAAHRQFDFWLGTWDVADAAGKDVGRNRITSVHGGCALLEEWQGRGGFAGTSLNAYDPLAQRWRQTWVDNAGGLLRLEGTAVDGGMRLEGETGDAGPPRTVARQRIEWSALPDGRVRQHWQASKDGGRTWTTVFDGWYRRVP